MPTKLSTIEQALLDATGLKPMKKDADRAKFLASLATAVENLPENKWEEMTKACPGAGEWYNAYGEAAEKKEELPEIPSDDDEDEDAESKTEEKDEDEDDKEKAPKKDAKKDSKKSAPKKDDKKAPAKDEKKSAPKKDDKKAPAKEKKSRGGAEIAIITAAIKKPKATADEIGEVVKEQGHKVAASTVKLQVMRTRRVMGVLQDLGKLS